VRENIIKYRGRQNSKKREKKQKKEKRKRNH
jgi:hypothetical protein